MNIARIALVLFLFASVASAKGRVGDEPIITPVASQIVLLDPANGQPKFSLKFDTQKLSRPVAVGQQIFVAGEHDLYALDANTGKVNWQHNTGSDAIFGLTANEKHVFIGAATTLIALDPEKGGVQWQFDGDIPIVEPTLVDDLVVFNALEGPAGVEQEGGKLRWQLTVQWGRFVFSPLSDKRLCVWKPDEIYVVETERGKTLWHNSPDQMTIAPGALPIPAVAADDVICQLRGTQKDANDFSLFIREAGSGRQLWKTPVGQHDAVGARTLIADKSAFSVLENQLIAVGIEDGKVKWQTQIKPLEAGGPHMIAAGGRLFLPALAGALTAVDVATGKAQWQSPPQKPSDGADIRVGGICAGPTGICITRNELLRK